MAFGNAGILWNTFDCYVGFCCFGLGFFCYIFFSTTLFPLSIDDTTSSVQTASYSFPSFYTTKTSVQTQGEKDPEGQLLCNANIAFKGKVLIKNI